MKYVCGILLSKGKFTLIKKNRPEWQKGKLNGIGGKIKSFRSNDSESTFNQEENPKVAMAREFEEETGVFIQASRWHCFHIESFVNAKTLKADQSGAKVYFFIALGEPEEIDAVETMTDEEVVIMTDDDMTRYPASEFVYNIPYLYLMILSNINNNSLGLLNPEGINYGS